MYSSLTPLVVREQAADHRERAKARQRVSRTLHPPSQLRRRTASAVARLAARLDEEAARVAVR